MPEFRSPFSGLANDRKLTDEELVRAIRFMVAAEYEATQLYTQLAESTDNKLAVKVLKEIADEELVHVGEFLRLLHELAPNEKKLSSSYPTCFFTIPGNARVSIGFEM
jgi:rubrerythrin